MWHLLICFVVQIINYVTVALHITVICRVSRAHGRYFVAALTWAFSVRQCGHSTGEFQQDLTLNSSPPGQGQLQQEQESGQGQGQG
jgi:hypothetical protein